MSPEEKDTHVTRMQEMRVEDCPCDEFGQTRVFEAWKGFSVWPQPSTAPPSQEAKMIDYYHLHPEMVETKSDGGGHEVKLCTSCVALIKKNEDLPRSIKAGVDFGSYHRIGLEPLSLAERNIISTYRHYSQAVKIESDGLH